MLCEMVAHRFSALPRPIRRAAAVEAQWMAHGGGTCSRHSCSWRHVGTAQ